MGHLEGITFIDSRGDGRYLISNGKDQSIKLWDVRKMSSNATTWYAYFLTCHVALEILLFLHVKVHPFFRSFLSFWGLEVKI